jgi:hypothetical protein
MTARSLTFVLAALFVFTGAVAQAHVSSVLDDQQRLLNRDLRSLEDDPFKVYRCYLRLDNESSESVVRSNETHNPEICLLPTPPQQITLNLAVEA